MSPTRSAPIIRSTRLVAILAALKARVLDDGNDWFQRRTSKSPISVIGNPATNVIPAQARARLNIRFNDHHKGADLADWVRAVVAEHAPSADVEVKISGEAFLTEPGELSGLVAAAVTGVTGCGARLVDKRRHVGCALHPPAVPGRRIRARRRLDAQD